MLLFIFCFVFIDFTIGNEEIQLYEIFVIDETCIAIAQNYDSYFYRLKIQDNADLIEKCKTVVLKGFSSVVFVRGYTEGTIDDLYMMNTTIGTAPFVQSTIKNFHLFGTTFVSSSFCRKYDIF